jgi:hypothetical protein
MKPLVVVNKRVLKQLLVPDRPEAYYNELIRRHFHRLTEVFLRPLEQYFASLVPAASTVSPFKPAPRIAAFSEDHFLKSLCRGASDRYVVCVVCRACRACCVACVACVVGTCRFILPTWWASRRRSVFDGQRVG